ncbi:hypothetical protein [Chryseolinea sp. H1M3-3]|uniref:hypothetical protein n=1 Tax=Chryseolinea sp. H1M3-3 TaxID=3034144 RepID=UPI0023EE0404|nr:hypothetical protein [Chryseolinea sp. H1M3-3]
MVVSHAASAQRADSLLSTSPFHRYWTKQRVVPKVGVGMQERAFFELGLAWHHIYKHPLTLLSKGPYCTVDIFVNNGNFLMGPKIGYEFTAGVFGAAIDVTYFIDQNYGTEDKDRTAWVTTPKVGLSVLGFADIFYGYEIPISSDRIDTISRNRFSIVFNLNRDYFDLKTAPRKR